MARLALERSAEFLMHAYDFERRINSRIAGLDDFARDGCGGDARP
jgi:hypothetical protein